MIGGLEASLVSQRLPNILWYCTDQQRSDTIGAWGNPHISTPNLDRLARSGVSFRRCYTQSPICTPSRASFLTGRYPATHHAHRNGQIRFPDSEKLVTRIVADAGYDCGLVGKLHLTAVSNGETRTDDGYASFEWSHMPRSENPRQNAYADWLRDEKGVDPLALYRDHPTFCGPGVPAELHQTTWCTERAIAFIDRPRDDRPWLLSVNPFAPHPPFDPAPEYLERIDPLALPFPVTSPQDDAHQRTFRDVALQRRDVVDVFGPPPKPNGARPVDPFTGKVTSPPEDSFDARYVKAAYYAQIEHIDAAFGRILDALEAAGELDNTIIIFTSDHGELLGDHGLILKGCRFYEGLVHVPLILSWPAGFKPGLECGALVELVDLAPTILEACGISVPDAMQGRSLMPIATGAAPPGHHKDFVVSEYNDAIGGQPPSHGTMVFDGRYKSCVYDAIDRAEIYDLLADPNETTDLFDSIDRELRARILLRHVQAYMRTSGAGIARGAHQ